MYSSTIASILLCFVALAQGIQVTCNFEAAPSTGIFVHVARLYSCRNFRIARGTNSSHFETVLGTHRNGNGMMNRDVRVFHGTDGTRQRTIPKGLISITNDDFRPHPELVHVYLRNNQIVSIDGNLFQYNPNLRAINMNNNLVRNVGEGILDNLNKLQEVDFGSNTCINTRAQTQQAITALRQQLLIHCPHSAITPTPTSTTAPTTTKSTTSTARTTCRKHSNNSCEDLENGTGLVNDPSSCSAYFSCLECEKYEQNCPHGLYFDESRLVCDYPQNVQCNSCPPTGLKSIADPSSCSDWVLCINGIRIKRTCGPGTYFDSRVGNCNFSQYVSCFRDTCAKLENGVGVAPDPDSCLSYLACFAGEKKQTIFCVPGLAFDIITSRCVKLGSQTCFPGTRA